MVARKKKIAVNTAKLEADNIYKTLMYFDTLYYKMDDSEKHELLSILIKEINIYENKQPNGQWLKQIVFSLPIIGDEELYMSLDKEKPVECAAILRRNSSM
jgi:site-specific DNA recombinase